MKNYLVILILLLFSCSKKDEIESSSSSVVWPISGTVTPNTLADFYGPRILSGGYDFHRGLDIPATAGTPVYSVMDGTVVRTEQTSTGDILERWGNFVVIAHENFDGLYLQQTAYLHLDSYIVTTGQIVSKGEIIGYVGRSGVGINTEHLHFEHYVGENSGLIDHLKTRNPLLILPYTSESPSVNISKTDTTLSFTITQSATSVDIIKIVITSMGMDSKTIDFHTREGMDISNDDTNPYQNITINVTGYSSGDAHYILTIDFAGSWASLESCSIMLENVQGINYSFTKSFI